MESDSLEKNESIDNENITTPVPLTGTWCEKRDNGILVGITTRSPFAFFSLPFFLLWLSIFFFVFERPIFNLDNINFYSVFRVMMVLPVVTIPFVRVIMQERRRE